MNRRIPPELAQWLLVAGIALLAIAFTLALYSVPTGVPGIPSFPFFSLPFPLLSALLVLSVILIGSGWISHPNGSFGQLLIGSATFAVAGVVLRAISFVAAVPLDLGGGVIIHVEPYGAHATMVVSVGPLLAIFGTLFWAADRRERRREKLVSEASRHQGEE